MQVDLSAWPVAAAVIGWVISVETRLVTLRSLKDTVEGVNRTVNRVDRRTQRIAVVTGVQDPATEDLRDELGV